MLADLRQVAGAAGAAAAAAAEPAPDATWVEVDLGAIQANTRRLRTLAGTRLMAVVKGNAYGHGLEAVSRAAAEAGADWFGVARTAEGLALRQAGLSQPVLVLSYTPPEQAAQAIAGRLSLAVSDLPTAQAYAHLARGLGARARVHVKVDTGMGRMGILPDQAPAFLQVVRSLPGIDVEGLFTHFASADSPAALSPRRQLSTFEGLVGALTAQGRRPPLVHAANSAATLTLPAARFDLVRTGILMYGLSPSDEVPAPAGFRAALSWKAVVAQVKTVPAGHGIGYGGDYVTRTDERVALVPVGYADGFRRVPSETTFVLLRGRRQRVLGRVSMDQIIVSLDGEHDVAPGETVVLLGEQGEAAISADETARLWGTINYEVVTGILARVPRLYR
jgi:alanine racemase